MIYIILPFTIIIGLLFNSYGYDLNFIWALLLSIIIIFILVELHTIASGKIIKLGNSFYAKDRFTVYYYRIGYNSRYYDHIIGVHVKTFQVLDSISPELGFDKKALYWHGRKIEGIFDVNTLRLITGDKNYEFEDKYGRFGYKTIYNDWGCKSKIIRENN